MDDQRQPQQPEGARRDLKTTRPLLGAHLARVTQAATVLVVTAVKVEEIAVDTVMSPLPFLAAPGGEEAEYVGHHDSGQYDYRVGLIGNYLAVHLYLRYDEGKPPGMTAQSLLGYALQDFRNLQLVLMSGISGGLQSEEFDGRARDGGGGGAEPRGQRIGDILVPTESIQAVPTINPKTGATGTGRDDYDVFTYRFNPMVVRGFQERTNRDPDWRARVHFGPLLCTPQVLRSAEGRVRLCAAFPEALGVEMESFTLGQAETARLVNSRQQQIYFFVAKAVCDWCDDNKPPAGHPDRPAHDRVRQDAADAAARYIHYLLSQPDGLHFIAGVAPFAARAQGKLYDNALGARGRRSARELEAPVKRAGEKPPDQLGALLTEGDARCLLVSGEAGMGKSFLLDRLAHALQHFHRSDRYYYLGCNVRYPTEETLRHLFEIGSGGDGEEFGPALAAKLAGQRAFVFLDDVDRALYDLKTDGSALRTLCDLAADGTIDARIVMAVKQEKEVAGAARAIFAGEQVAGPRRIGAFSEDEAERYLCDAFPDVGAETRALLRETARESEGHPLLLSLLRAEFAGRTEEEIADWVRAEVLPHRGRGRAPLMNTVFAERHARQPEEGRALLRALAVLRDPAFTARTYLSENARAVLEVAGPSFASSLMPLDPATLYRRVGEQLKAADILVDERQGGDSDGGDDLPGYLFRYDAERDFVYDALDDAEREELHGRAADAYAGLYAAALSGAGGSAQVEDSEDALLGYRALRAWHGMLAGGVEDALRQIERLTSAFESRSRYRELIAFRTRARARIETLPGRPTAALRRKRDLWARNEVHLADNIYQGATFGEEIARIAGRVKETYVEDDEWEELPPAEQRAAHNNRRALALARLIDASCQFEALKTPFAGADAVERFHAAVREFQGAQAEAEEVCRLLNTRGDDSLPEPLRLSLLANACATLAMFYNRRGMWEKALATYDRARAAQDALAALLETRRADIPPVDYAALEKIRTFDRFHVDYSRSRTVFLAGGPEAALESVEPWLGDGGRDVRSSIEYLYLVANAGTSLVSLGRLDEAESLLKRTQRSAYQGHRKREDYLPGDLAVPPHLSGVHYACGGDFWPVAGLDCLRGAIALYRGEFERARETFDFCAALYAADGYARDVPLMRTNAHFARLAARRVEITPGAEDAALAEIADALVEVATPVMDEPIVLANVWYVLDRLAREYPGLDAPRDRWREGMAARRLAAEPAGRTEARFGGAIAAGGERGWREPFVVRGALNLRTVPFLQFELEDI